MDSRKKIPIILLATQVVLAITAVIVALVVGAELEPLLREKAELETQVNKLAEQATALREERDRLLREFGWSPEQLKRVRAGYISFGEIIEAQKERRILASKTRVEPRRSVRIEYFSKRVDPAETIVESLEELGFQVVVKEPKNRRSTNSVWFGEAVAPASVKLIAYTLVRAGVHLQVVQSFDQPGGRRAHLVQIGRDPHAVGKRPLTVEEIKAGRLEG